MKSFLALHTAALRGGQAERDALAEAMFAVIGAHDADGLSVRVASNYPGPGSLWSLVGPRGEELARLHGTAAGIVELCWVRPVEEARRLRKEELERARVLGAQCAAAEQLVARHLLSGCDVAYRPGLKGGVFRVPDGAAGEVVSAFRTLCRCGLTLVQVRERLTWAEHAAWSERWDEPPPPEWSPFRLGLDPLAWLVIESQARPRLKLVAEAVERLERWLRVEPWLRPHREPFDVEAARCLAYDLTIDAPAVSAHLYALVGFMRDEIGWQSHAARAVALLHK